MKKLLSVLLILILCLTFTACKKDTADATDSTPAQTECSEQDIKQLVEQNIDCYYLFYVAPLSTDGEPGKDGYSKADTGFFSDYTALYDFVSSTYTSSKTKALLEYPTTDKPLYKDVENEIYVNADVIDAQTYSISWDDFDVEFTKNSTTQCEFTLYTTTFDGEEYTTEGEAIYQNSNWLLTDIIY